MAEQYTKEELSNYVYVTSREPFTAMWDGKEYDIDDSPIMVKKGIAIHWESVHDAELDMKEVTPEEVEEIGRKNPLEENDRGESFVGLKRGRKPKE